MKKSSLGKIIVSLLAMVSLLLNPQISFASNGKNTKHNAEESERQVLVTEEATKAVFSIDAGRKYFSEQQIKELIHHAYLNGYTDVQLILANDAARFFLDDMSITLENEEYSSEDVKAALTQGNGNYYDDPNGNALTEAEMDRIISFADERNIGIIPLINSPGHMDSILDGMEILGIDSPHFETSKRTVSLENKEALEFTKALIDKYAAYFSKYASVFNIGADEYANDVNTAGWSGIQKSGLYTNFVEYVNDLSAIVKGHGMSPMVYNDGIYYNGKDSFGEFDSDLIIAYWTAGWWGFDVAKPEFFINKGHELISSNDGWYWVIGNYTPNDGIYDVNGFYNRIENIPFNTIPGKADASIPALGSIHSVWADNPSKPHDFDTIFSLMNKFSKVHSDYMNRLDAVRYTPKLSDATVTLSNGSKKNLEKGNVNGVLNGITKGKGKNKLPVVTTLLENAEDLPAETSLEYGEVSYTGDIEGITVEINVTYPDGSSKVYETAVKFE